MAGQQQAETVPVKACSACRGGLLEADQFCRWCGEAQMSRTGAAYGETGTVVVVQSPSLDPVRYQTSALDSADASRNLYHRVSGPLLSAVVAGASRSATGELRSAFLRRAILALISVPIWMIIVLLSPLDAYVAARNVVKGVQ
jgi:hypothetical protein